MSSVRAHAHVEKERARNTHMPSLSLSLSLSFFLSDDAAFDALALRGRDRVAT